MLFNIEFNIVWCSKQFRFFIKLQFSLYWIFIVTRNRGKSWKCRRFWYKASTSNEIKRNSSISEKLLLCLRQCTFVLNMTGWLCSSHFALFIVSWCQEHFKLWEKYRRNRKFSWEFAANFDFEFKISKIRLQAFEKVETLLLIMQFCNFWQSKL